MSLIELDKGNWLPLSQAGLHMPERLGIYCIQNTVNGKEYVGMSINLKQRLQAHLAMQYDRKPLYRAMKKYGIDKFQVKLLQVNPWDSLGKLEADHIKLRNTLAPNGYNCTEGGEGTFGFRHSEATKQAAKERTKLQFSIMTEEEKQAKATKVKEWWATADNKQVMVKKMANRPQHSEERKAKQVELSRARWHSDEAFREAVRLGAEKSWTAAKRASVSAKYSGGGNPKARVLAVFHCNSLYALYYECAEEAAKVFNVSGETMRRWAKEGSTPKIPNTAFCYL